MKPFNYLIIISVLVAIFVAVAAPFPFHGKKSEHFNYLAII